jgi:hypothetical protein
VPSRKLGINALSSFTFEVTSLCRLYAQGSRAYALLSDTRPRGGDPRTDWNATMNDLTAVGLFFGCLVATLGLVRVCEWLRPHVPALRGDQATGNSGSSALTEEARQ